MKALKKILIYLAFMLGFLIVAVLVCFAVMYFSPGTSILGYEYVSYNKLETQEFNINTNPLFNNVKGVELTTEESDIYIYPNSQSNIIKVEYKQGLSGFVKSINSNLALSTKFENKDFEESASSVDIFSINIDEPNGWVAKNNSYVCIYLPQGITYRTISAKSQGGNIFYYTQNPKSETDETLACTNLYLKTANSNKLTLNTNNTHNAITISNYYLTTDGGNVYFQEASNINATTVKFVTNSGSFNLSNSQKNATLTVTDFIVKSSDAKRGPSIIINKLVGNLKANCNAASFKIDEIGSYGNYKSVTMTVNNAQINFGNVYAFVSILSYGNNIKNNVSINKLDYTAMVNMIECGEGSASVGYLNGNISFDATTGNVVVYEASITSNIDAYTSSGNISVNYVESQEDNKTTKLKMITHTGNISASNISCALDILVLSNSAKSTVNIVFTAVTSVENFIDAKDRVVNITSKGLNENLKYRVVCDCDVEFLGSAYGIGSVIGEFENDYLLSVYEDFTNNYRIGYQKVSAEYNEATYLNMGKLLINSSKIRFNTL